MTAALFRDPAFALAPPDLRGAMALLVLVAEGRPEIVVPRGKRAADVVAAAVGLPDGSELLERLVVADLVVLDDELLCLVPLCRETSRRSPHEAKANRVSRWRARHPEKVAAYNEARKLARRNAGVTPATATEGVTPPTDATERRNGGVTVAKRGVTPGETEQHAENTSETAWRNAGVTDGVTRRNVTPSASDEGQDTSPPSSPSSPSPLSPSRALPLSSLSLSLSPPSPLEKKAPETRVREGGSEQLSPEELAQRAADEVLRKLSEAKRTAAASRRAAAARKADVLLEASEPAFALAEFLRTDSMLAEITARPCELARRFLDPQAYPGLDVVAEVKRAAAWLAANPAQSKKNGARFLTNWLSHAQERSRRPPTDRRDPPRGPARISEPWRPKGDLVEMLTGETSR